MSFRILILSSLCQIQTECDKVFFMGYKETFFFYDLETFGLNSQHDRIAQFAGIRVNTNLEVVEEPVVFYCKQSEDYLPDPLAVLVTHILPQEVNENGFIEKEFMKKIYEIFSVPRTCVVGYNSLKFDDEFIRNGFFRNFFDPYEREYKKGNSRFDIFSLVRSAYDFRPEGIVWPMNEETNRPRFSLTALTTANNIPHEGAHDALSDVWATLNLARLIYRKQPKLFSYFLTMRDKQYVKSLLKTPFGEPVALTDQVFGSTSGSTRIISPITASKMNANLIYAFDLSQDPSELIMLSSRVDTIINSKINRDKIHKALQVVSNALLENEDDEVLKRASEALSIALEELDKLPHLLEMSTSLISVKGIVKISINKIPFISPLKTISGDEETARRLNINVDECMRNYTTLLNSQNIPLNIVQEEHNITYKEIDDVDFSLYSGSFLSSNDQERCTIIRETKKEELKEIDFPFDDERLDELLWRYRCRNFSETLDETELKEWHGFCAQRIMQPIVKNGFGLSFFVRKIEENLQNNKMSDSDKKVLVSLKEYAKGLLNTLGITYPEPNL